MKKDKRTRKWQVTINNPLEHGMDHAAIRAIIEEMQLDYACLCDEIGEEGTYHTHVFIQGKNAIRFSTMKAKFPSGHLEMCNGTAQENRDYIRKEGKHAKSKKKETNLPETFEEFGECPIERPGHRSDLDDLYDWITEGRSNAEIIKEEPRYMFSLDKIDNARQTILEAKYRSTERDIHVEYWYGETGVGKTRGLFDLYGYEDVYRITDYDHPWDSYRQQRVVAFEEFHSSRKIQEMLNWLDRYPLELPCRYHNKWACYEFVYIITNISFEEQYSQVQKDYPGTFEALRRRIHVFKYMSDSEDAGLKVADCPF